FTIVFILFEKWISPFIFSSQIENQSLIYILITVLIFVNGMFYFVQNQLRWNLQVRENATANVINSLTTIFTTVVCIVIYDYGVIGVLVGMISGNVVGGIFAYLKSRTFYKLFFEKEFLIKMIKFSLPLVPSSIAVFLNLYLDRLIIKNQLGLGYVGLYAVAYRFASVISLVLIGFQASLTPLIYAEYKKASTPQAIEKLFRVFLFIIIILGSGVSIFSHEILVLFTQPEYFEATLLIGPLTFATILSNIYIFTPGMAIANKTKRILFINFLTVIVNLMLSIALLQIIGVYGVALALFISNLILFMMYMYNSQKFYKIPFQFNRLLATLAIIITCLIMALYLESLIVKIISYLLVNLILMMVLFSRNELKIVLNKAKIL
ncbi:oligosaccharide flippase family protein, partial [Solibacillus silvestris]|uniref:oligosaccharide flippase family protein n=1 Tax=Solibacillus silvestris TaxID=76853 RepID=UPI003F7EA747